MASHLPDRKHRLMSVKTGGKRRNAEETENKRRMEYLKQVIVCLGPERREQADALCDALRRENIRCGRYPEEDILKQIRTGCGWNDSAVVITDSRALSSGLAGSGIVCIGCAASEEAFFDGTAFVTDCPEQLDGRTLEEYLLRMTGRPVTIAETGRLILREIAEKDIDRLYEISRQKGMERALSDPSQEAFFRRENLQAYIRTAYRFYGYGLWSVLLKDRTLIGCCGFSERSETDIQARSEVRLELQYMLDEAYRRCGYATEMCRAALHYAALQTAWENVYVRIRPDNEPSLRLAGKLGFRRPASCDRRSLQEDFIMLEYTLCKTN